MLGLLNGRLATGEILEDAMITLSESFVIVRPVGGETGSQILLLVTADRHRTNLAMAHRSIRDLRPNFPA